MIKKTRRLALLAALFLMAICGWALSACSSGVTLKFNANGGVALDEIAAVSGDLFELPTPVYDGMIFGGWYTSEDYSGTAYSGTITVPQENTTYYAKWEKGYAVKLDAKGGSAPLTELLLPAGANVFDALKNVAASKEGLSFGAWFYGETEIVPSLKMPEEDIMLTAKYKANYTVETYLQNLAGNAYVGSGEVRIGSGYVGEIVRAEQPMLAHYEYNATPENYRPVTALELSENAAENVFKLYYDRTVYPVIYSGNSALAEGSVPEQRVIYGNAFSAAQNGFSLEGHRFAGWSTSPSGDVEYVPGQEIFVEASTVLYAVWDRGYTDRYGSGDLVFFPRMEQGKAYMLRGGYEFEGTRDGEDFLFEMDTGKELRGRIYGSSFSYARTDLLGSYIYYANSSNPADGDLDEQLDKTRKLEIDEYMNGTYTDGAHVCTGEIVFDIQMGDYVFTSGDHSFHFLMSNVEDTEGVRHDVYAVGGPEMGAYVDFYLINRETGAGYAGMNMMLMLDGYRTASLLDVSNYLFYDGYYYVEDVYGDASNPIYKIVLLMRDPNGYLSGTPGSIAYNYIYTVSLSGEYDGFVVYDETRGSYKGEDGATLELDGFGIFADSAVYTADGVVYSGPYEVENDILTGRTVTINAQGRKFVFRLNEEEHTIEDPVVRESYTVYRQMNGNALSTPFAVLYDDVTEGEGLKAELYVPALDGGSSLVCAAKGYYSSQPIGISRFNIIVVTITERTAGYEEFVPERELVFFNSVATSVQTQETYNIYCLLRWDDREYFQTVQIEGGGYILKSTSVTADGMGSLYVRSGSVEEGSFSNSVSEHFYNEIGTFLYVDEQGYVREILFDIFEREDGTIGAALSEGKETMIYVVPRTGYDESIMGREVIFTDGKERVKYTEDGGTSYRDGTYKEVDNTVFGDTVYSLVIGGSEFFRFVIRYRQEYGDELTFASVYNAKCDKLFQNDGGELLLDGFYRARYTSADGRVLFGEYDGTERQISFMADDGMEYIVKLDAENAAFRFVDWAAGREWALLDTNYLPVNGLSLQFDGEGTAILTASGRSTFGAYSVLTTTHEFNGKAYPEYLLHADLGRGYGENTYRLTFAINEVGMGACILFREDAEGYFVNDEWTVLTLDGYGFGKIISGEFSGSGSYTYVDASERFYEFAVDDPYSAVDGQTFYFVLHENGTFYMTDYKAYAGMWIASDLTSIAFTESGMAYIGAESAPYYVQNNVAHVFTSPRRNIQLPSGNALRFSDKTYYLWNGGEIVMDGKVRFLDKDGEVSREHPSVETTLSFKPNGTTNARLNAKFLLSADGGEAQEYDFTLTLGYTDEGEYVPHVAYELKQYEIAFAYDGTENSTFTVTAGYNEVVYLDHNARWEPDITTPRGGRLVKTTFGFGPISYGGVMLSGQFLYLYDENDPSTRTPISFEDIPETELETVGFSPTYGWRQELLFTYNGVDYCWDYYEYYSGGNYFFTYGLYTYETFTADGFEVRVMRFKYSHMSTTAGYVDYTVKGLVSPAVDKAVYVTLFQEGKPVVAYDTCYTLEAIGSSVWIVDREGVVEDTAGRDTCTWGTGYLVTFQYEGEKITGVKVERYRFVQVVLYMEYLVNLFVDGEGNVQIVGFGDFYAPLGRYNWLENPSRISYDGESGVFNFVNERQVKEGSGFKTVTDTYTVTVRKGEDNEAGDPTYEVTVECGSEE